MYVCYRINHFFVWIIFSIYRYAFHFLIYSDSIILLWCIRFSCNNETFASRALWNSLLNTEFLWHLLCVCVCFFFANTLSMLISWFALKFHEHCHLIDLWNVSVFEAKTIDIVQPVRTSNIFVWWIVVILHHFQVRNFWFKLIYYDATFFFSHSKRSILTCEKLIMRIFAIAPRVFVVVIFLLVDVARVFDEGDRPILTKIIRTVSFE